MGKDIETTFTYYTQYTAKYYAKGRGAYGCIPREIVIHHWGNPGQQFDNVIKFFVYCPSEVSAHYVVESGKVACLVDCADTAWHAGNREENYKSIGIECRPEATDGDVHTVAELVASLWATYPNMSRKLRFHKEFFDTACPGKWMYKLREIETLASKMLQAGTGKIDAPKRPQPPVKNYKLLKVADNATIAEFATHTAEGIKLDGYRGKTGKIVNVKNHVQSFSKRAYKIDGIDGYVLEQDILQADGKTPANIQWIKPQTTQENNKKEKEKNEKISKLLHEVADTIEE